MNKKDEALDRMAENARELGLDYEPAQQEPHGWYIDGYGAVLGASEPKSVRPGEWLPFYTSPQPAQPSNRTWTQEHWTEYERNIAAAAKAEEREACAKVCEDIDTEYEGEDVLATWCAAAIRARKENT